MSADVDAGLFTLDSEHTLTYEQMIAAYVPPIPFRERMRHVWGHLRLRRA